MSKKLVIFLLVLLFLFTIPLSGFGKNDKIIKRIPVQEYWSGLNVLPFLSSSGIELASEWVDEITSSNEDISIQQVFGWNAEVQGWEHGFVDLGGNFMGDFELEPGRCYYLHMYIGE